MRLALHSYWRSSCSWRVRIGLGWKGLAWTYRAVDLLRGDQGSPEHRARNPMGQVPVLEVEEGGRTERLTQSMAILEWLEERFPDRPLLPRDPLARARVRALAENVNSGVQPFQNAATLRWLREAGPGADAAWLADRLGGALDALEASVRPVAGRFAFGDEVTLADLFVVPQLHGARRFGLDLARLPTLVRVEGACRELEPFRLAEPERQPDAPPAAAAPPPPPAPPRR